MIQRLRIWKFNHRTWIYNTQYIVYSLILLVFVMLIDLRYWEFQDYIPRIFFTSVSLAKTVLAALAGAQLTITTFTFSTILSIMVNYSSNYSPRVIENFVKQKITMKVLGIFFGGFFYSITSLIFMRDLLEEKMVIAGFVGVVYAVVSMIYFILFVQKVIHSMQSTNLISEIYEEALGVIRQEVKKREENDGFVYQSQGDAVPVISEINGYLSLVDYSMITDLLKEEPNKFVIECKVGDYITEGTILGYLSKSEKGTPDEDLSSKLNRAFLVQEEKVFMNDYRYGITKLVEITLRAISPGINDPNTAIHCIRKISLLLVLLSKSAAHHIAIREDENVQIAYTCHSFSQDLYETFYQILHYGKEDVSVMHALLEGMELLYHNACKENREIILNYVQEIYQSDIDMKRNDYDRKYLKDIYHRIVLIQGM